MSQDQPKKDAKKNPKKNAKAGSKNKRNYKKSKTGASKNKNQKRSAESRRNATVKPYTPKEIDLTKVRCYGDLINDGAIQMSFTLPVPSGPEAKVAAKQMIEKMGLKNVKVIHSEAMSAQYTFFVVYAISEFEIDYTKIDVPKLEYPEYTFDEVNFILKDDIGRTITVLGACIGSDAHTVGIDAIFNMKGYLGNYGLERYSQINALNLRAQVDVNDLADKVVETQADAVLISRVVTQRDEHITEMKKFLEVLKTKENVPEHLVTICGGPRVDNALAKEMGFDAGFGPGTLPSQVASFITHELVKRIGI